MNSRKLRFASLLGAGLLASQSLWLAAAGLPYESADMSVGSGSCARSTCHGAVAPWQDTPVQHNEFLVWQKQDPHAHAYTALDSDEARRMVRKLGLDTLPTDTRLCLDCHSHNPPAAQRAPSFDAREGVSCEACHGPAGRWQDSHAETGSTHARHLADGLYPTSDPVAQASLCVSCHVGDANRHVTHRLMGAGHPRLVFEIDTFSAMGPGQHYRMDDDWHQRKGEFDPVVRWAAGQVLTARYLLDSLADPQRGRDGLFPELTLYDCHACHHPMTRQRAGAPVVTGPGRLRLNDSHLLVAQAVVQVLAPDRAESINRQVTALQQAAAGQAGGHLPQLAQQLSGELTQILQQLPQQTFNHDRVQALMQALVAQPARYADYSDAEQVYMSLASLQPQLTASEPATTAIRQQLLRLRETVSSETGYQPQAFAQALDALRPMLSSPPR